jgi:hypothetical protein
VKNVKLQSKTLSLLKKELQGSLIAVQLMLAMGTYAIMQNNKRGTKVASVAKIAKAIRNEMKGPKPGRKKGNFFDTLSNATREQRQRTTPKEKRPWPRLVSWPRKTIAFFILILCRCPSLEQLL